MTANPDAQEPTDKEAWERFERVVDAAVKSEPLHKKLPPLQCIWLSQHILN
jgi:hypothetical protein